LSAGSRVFAGGGRICGAGPRGSGSWVDERSTAGKNPGKYRETRRGNTIWGPRLRLADQTLEVGSSSEEERQEGRTSRESGVSAGEEENFGGSSVEEVTEPGPWPVVKEPYFANPRIGCGVQQTRGLRDGARRQGGEKPWRRNRTCRVATVGRRGPEVGDHGREPGVDVAESCRWRGDL
jgi:hypothetical protein